MKLNSVATARVAPAVKGAAINVLPSQDVAEMLDILYRRGLLGATSKREFARQAVEDAVRAQFKKMKDAGLL